MLDERVRSGRLDLRDFWRRRFRRLLPASIAAIALVVLTAVAVGDHTQRVDLPGDVVGALVYVANWRFLLAEQSYGDLFANPSPLLHFWSLAVEEQFYLTFPLVVVGLWWIGRRRAAGPVPARADVRRLGSVLGVLAAGSLAATVLVGTDHERIYMGTDTRAFEVLAGCLLAVVVHGAGRRGWYDAAGRPQQAVAALGALTLAGAVAAWATIGQSDPALYRGGLALYALGSCATVLAACAATGPVARMLAARPLVHLGHISYGVYLYHWPIFLWLRQGTTWGPWPRFVVGVALALAVAELSARFLERPIRAGAPLLGSRPWTLTAPAMVALVVLAVGVRADAPRPVVDLEAAAAAQAITDEAPSPPTTAPPAGPPQARVAFFGDSTGMMTGDGFGVWLEQTGRGVLVPGGARIGCGIMGGEELRVASAVSAAPSTCADWPTEWAAAIAHSQPTTVVVQLGAWDIQERRFGDDPTWRAPGDPVYDAELRRRLVHVVDVLSAGGATVVWLPSPTASEGHGTRLPDPDYDRIAWRITILNDLVAELPSLRPGKVRVVDLAGWFEATGEQRRLRPDGMHFSRETATEVAERFLGEAILGPPGWNRPAPPPAA